MNFYNLINELDKEIKYDLYIDMDGVVASYRVGFPCNFDKKRPLITNINNIKRVCEFSNITPHILSICKKDSQIEEKNVWLDKYMSFIAKENRHILSKETYQNMTSSELKVEFLKKCENRNIIMLDDDNTILKDLSKNIDGIILFQDSELVD